MDYARFEQLSGTQLALYVSDVIKRTDLDDGILEYSQKHSELLDGPHLEMILLLLERLGTSTALTEVCRFLYHPVKSVRYQAIQVISNAPSLREDIMMKVIEILSNPHYPDDIIKIDGALDHGGTEAARLLALRFRQATRKSVIN